MTLPSIILGAVVATLLGAAFHLWRGGSLGHLLLYLALAWLGFWAGHWFAAQLDLSLFQVGPLDLLICTEFDFGLSAIFQAPQFGLTKRTQVAGSAVLRFHHPVQFLVINYNVTRTNSVSTDICGHSIVSKRKKTVLKSNLS